MQQITVQYLKPVNQKLLYQFGTNIFAIYGKTLCISVLWELKIWHISSLGQQITVQYLTPVNQQLLNQFGTIFLWSRVKHEVSCGN